MGFLKKLLGVLLRIAISIAILVFLFKNIDIRNLTGIIKNADKLLVVISSLVFLSAYILAFLRWRMLLAALNIHLPLKRTIASYAAGLFFNLFLPSSIGGDFMRSVDLSVHTKKPKEIIATVFLDRLSGYIGLVILAVSVFFLGWDFLREESILFSLFIIVLILVVVLLVLFNKFIYGKIKSFLKSPDLGQIRELLTDLHEEIHLFRNRRGVVVKNIALSVLIQAMTPASFYILAISLGIRISPIYFFVFLPIIGAITLLPISIGGLGLRDATAIYFFAKAGVPKDMTFAMSLLNFSFIIIFGALGGLIYVFTVHHRRLQRNT